MPPSVASHMPASPASRMVFAPSGPYNMPPDVAPPPPQQQQQQAPQTIQSTLNPNAPDFSSRSAAPPVMMAPPFAGAPHHHGMRVPFTPQDFLQQGGMGHPHHPHHGGAPLGSQHPGVFPLQVMAQLSHLQQYSGLVTQVGQMPKAERTPLGVRLTDEGSPSSVSPQQAGGLSPTAAALGQHPGMAGDDRKLPRPIGTERAQKKNVGPPSYPNPAMGIWSYPNSAGAERLRVAGGAGAGNAVSSELNPMAAWVQYQQCAGAQGDGLPPLLHNRFAEPLPEPILEHPYHQQLNSNPGGCPPFLNGFPGGAGGPILGGCAGAQLFPPTRVAAEAPHQQQQQEAPWSPHKMMGPPQDPLHHHGHHHHQHHPQQQQQQQHHQHVANKLPWQGWAPHQT